MRRHERNHSLLRFALVFKGNHQHCLRSGGQQVADLAQVHAFRETDDTTPIVLMGYYNPIYARQGGVARFLADAVAAGVDGLIVVDLPPEEDAELCLPARAAGLNFIRLATPTTDDRRLPAVVKNTSGFVYYVSVTGITGGPAADATEVAPEVARIRASASGMPAPRPTRLPPSRNAASAP